MAAHPYRKTREETKVEEKDGDQIIGGYVDNLKAACRLVKDNNMIAGLDLGIESIIDDMDELRPLLNKKSHLKRLKADAEKFTAKLLESCRDGNEAMSLGNMRQLRDRIAALKVLFGREK